MEHLVTVITVAYRSDAVLPDLAASLPPGTPWIVVNNGPDLAGAPPPARIIGAGGNIGFGRACNLGASAADTEYLLFLNPDAALGEGALDALVQAAQRAPDVSGWNPVIEDRAGMPQRRRRSKTGNAGLAEGDLETLHGCAIFVRRADFERIGGFDPAIFLYHEDDDLSCRLRTLGPLRQCQSARVRHLSGCGAVRTPQTAALKAFHMARSRVYFLTKHGRRWAGATTLARALGGHLAGWFRRWCWYDASVPRPGGSFAAPSARCATGGGMPKALHLMLRDWKRRRFADAWRARHGDIYDIAGVAVHVPPRVDANVRYLLAKGRPYEAEETAFAQRVLHPGDNVIELGGSIGILTAIVQKRIGISGRHIVVEADPLLVPVLRRNAPNADVRTAAIAYSDGRTVRFSRGATAHEGRLAGPADVEVFDAPVLRFAPLAAEMAGSHYSLLCDIEGAELDLFRHEPAAAFAGLSWAIVEVHPRQFADQGVDIEAFIALCADKGLALAERRADVLLLKGPAS